MNHRRGNPQLVCLFRTIGQQYMLSCLNKKTDLGHSNKISEGGLTSAVKRVRLGLNKMCMKRRKKVCRKVLKSDNMTQVKRN